jgi:hypothetical protein
MTILYESFQNVKHFLSNDQHIRFQTDQNDMYTSQSYDSSHQFVNHQQFEYAFLETQSSFANVNVLS